MMQLFKSVDQIRFKNPGQKRFAFAHDPLMGVKQTSRKISPLQYLDLINEFPPSPQYLTSTSIPSFLAGYWAGTVANWNLRFARVHRGDGYLVILCDQRPVLFCQHLL